MLLKVFSCQANKMPFLPFKVNTYRYEIGSKDKIETYIVTFSLFGKCLLWIVKMAIWLPDEVKVFSSKWWQKAAPDMIRYDHSCTTMILTKWVV